jgi:Tol biopolymer transport system component
VRRALAHWSRGRPAQAGEGVRRPLQAGIAIACLLSLAAAAEAPPTLLTVPQQDRFRLSTGPASASISADGRYIAFASYVNLSEDDRDPCADIYLLDRETGRATLESVGIDGFAHNTDSLLPRISADGRYIAFETSIAGNEKVVTGTGVVLRDRVAGTARLISRTPSGDLPDGWSASPAVSDDGGTIVFSSAATNLTTDPDLNGSMPDIYQFDPRRSLVTRISLNLDGLQPSEGASVTPAISGDGRHVAFSSTADIDGQARRSRSAASGRSGRPIWHLFVRDNQSKKTIRVWRKGVMPDGSSSQPVLSRDGRFLAFVSFATNLVSADRNKSTDIFLFDTTTKVISLVSRGVGGRPANGASWNPTISADGRRIAFQSNASDLVCAERCPPDAEDINLLPDVFVLDRVTDTMTQVSVGDGSWLEESGAPTIDATGNVIAFTSKHPIDAQDVDDDFDLFVRVSSR